MMELSKSNIKDEVRRFRSEFKPEIFERAESAVRLERNGSTGVIVFDAPDSKANTLGTAVMLRFFELLCEVDEDKAIKALVVRSAKPSIFIAGADISEIKRLTQGEEGATEALMKLQSVFTFLENMSIPTIAAIHGACMGGGTELVLGCDYRMASDDKATKIALPEVLLGVLPGWGGTQRLPKLIGLEASLDMILTGRAMDSRKSKKLGLVDKVVPVELLEEKALAWAEELAKKGKKRERTPANPSMLSRIPGSKYVIFDQARKTVMKKTYGNYPAPLKAIKVMQKTYGGDQERGLKVEAKAFAELVTTPVAKNLISIFYLQEGVKKGNGVSSNIKPAPVSYGGVLGAGVMGGGIAQLFAAKGLRVRMKDISWKAINQGYQAAFKIFKKLKDRRKLRRFDVENAMARIEATTSYSGFQQLDLVVEAVVESMDIKKKVFQELEANTNPKAVLATNTSSLSVTEIATAVKDPSRVVGMHFFNPVDKMPLVEIIRGEKTSDEAVATIYGLSKKLGKTPIVVKDGPGFVVNRILAPYLNEAAFLMLEGVEPKYMDKVLEKFGMPMGPATLLDEIGLDVAAKVSKILYGAFGDRMKAPTIFDKVAEDGRLGKKSGKGIYIYDGKDKTEDFDWLASVGASTSGHQLTDDEIEKRLVYIMVNEASRCVEEQMVEKVSDLDIGMIFGTGFAPFRGGLLRYADSVGIENIVNDLEVFTRAYGERFKPAPYLQELAVSKKKFYS